MDAAVGRHRAMLCGSIGLIAAVPLTTLLAAAFVGRGAEASQSPTTERRPAGRTYALRGRLAPEQEPLVLDTVLGPHAPRLSHAAVGVNSASLAQEDLPAGAREAALTLRQLAATASRRNGSRYRRALTASTAYLDLQDPNQLDLLRRYGPFSTDLTLCGSGPRPLLSPTA